jgi:hypothetical protein
MVELPPLPPKVDELSKAFQEAVYPAGYDPVQAVTGKPPKRSAVSD